MIYLASPYTHTDPAVQQQRFEEAARAAATILREGRLVFSPIVHGHPIASHGEFPGNWEAWEAMALWHIKRCDKLVVLKLPGWSESRGIKAEVDIAARHHKPVELWDWPQPFLHIAGAGGSY